MLLVLLLVFLFGCVSPPTIYPPPPTTLTDLPALYSFNNYVRGRVLKLPQNKFFESFAITSMFPDLVERDQWLKYDWVGTVAWKVPVKFLGGFSFGPFNISDILASAPVGTDVIGLAGAKGARSVLANTKDQRHFWKVWSGLLTAFNRYTPHQISTAGMKPFYCNYWLARPEHVLKLIGFTKRVQFLLDNLTSIQGALWSKHDYFPNAKLTQKVFGLDYYTYHPFILERITPFFFHAEKLNVFIYKSFIKSKIKNVHSENDGKVWDKALSLRLPDHMIDNN